MYVKRVVLENIRGFRKLDFRFGRSTAGEESVYAGWYVITGDNASGKTSLLKALAVALVGPDAFRSLQPSLRGWIRRGADREDAIMAAELVPCAKDRFVLGKPYQGPFWGELSLVPNGGEPAVRTAGKGKYRGKGKGPIHGPWAENPSGWYCAGYGPFRRLYGHSPEAQRIMSGPGRLARFATMFREDATLGECELWLKELHHKQLENKPPAAEILAAVIDLLNDDFLQNGIVVEKVDSEGLWLKQANGVILPLADMSDGYRAALAMVVDILRHMVAVFGHEGLIAEKEGRKRVDLSGVVLIDEIDSHLHPEWQRKIGFWLKEIFPKVQFIVTTHSPLICQAAERQGIYHLPSPGEDKEPFQLSEDDCGRIIRERPNEIYISPAFGLSHTRSPRAVEAQGKYARLQAKKHAGRLSSHEKREMEQLELFVDPESLDD